MTSGAAEPLPKGGDRGWWTDLRDLGDGADIDPHPSVVVQNGGGRLGRVPVQRFAVAGSIYLTVIQQEADRQ
ncbi:hypothetical protein [Amycolatopsis sp. YIM 10]|uniref:hypothetical protein n=1 Tax=Amycolatopsis sp. YIM 10 TaxID=2653857 RepID=UPI001883B688|nr:hypothetical protein [Amycolatopsis sp. YIM 10]